MWEGRTGKYLARIYNARAEKAQKKILLKSFDFFFDSEQEDNNLSKNATFLISGFFFRKKAGHLFSQRLKWTRPAPHSSAFIVCF